MRVLISLIVVALCSCEYAHRTVITAPIGNASISAAPSYERLMDSIGTNCAAKFCLVSVRTKLPWYYVEDTQSIYGLNVEGGIGQNVIIVEISAFCDGFPWARSRKFVNVEDFVIACVATNFGKVSVDRRL